MLPILSSFFK